MKRFAKDGESQWATNLQAPVSIRPIKLGAALRAKSTSARDTIHHIEDIMLMHPGAVEIIKPGVTLALPNTERTDALHLLNALKKMPPEARQNHVFWVRLPGALPQDAPLDVLHVRTPQDKCVYRIITPTLADCVYERPKKGDPLGTFVAHPPPPPPELPKNPVLGPVDMDRVRRDFEALGPLPPPLLLPPPPPVAPPAPAPARAPAPVDLLQLALRAADVKDVEVKGREIFERDRGACAVLVFAFVRKAIPVIEQARGGKTAFFAELLAQYHAMNSELPSSVTHLLGDVTPRQVVECTKLGAGALDVLGYFAKTAFAEK